MRSAASMTWARAHQQARVRSARIHRRLGIGDGAGRVGVEEAVVDAGITLLWRPMPRLFGAFVREPHGSPGILVNSQLPPAARRQTLAHELGHWAFDHLSTADDEKSLAQVVDRDGPVPQVRQDLMPTSAHVDRGWPTEEKLAEAFGCWFLMPPTVVTATMSAQGLTVLAGPCDVYQLSTALAVPYRALCRHLPSLGLATRERAERFMAVGPGRLKRELSGRRTPHDVHVVSVPGSHAAAGGRVVPVHAYAGDLIVLPAGAAGSDLSVVPAPPGPNGVARVVHEVAPVSQRTSVVVTVDGAEWQLNVHPTPHGEHDRSHLAPTNGERR